jgi:hypothetical protein
MKIKLKIILVLLFIANAMFSQQGISLFNQKNGDLEFIKEHHRIKIKTDNGKNIAGQFTIIDSTTIQIKDHIINLNHIVKIRKASGFSTFMETGLITVGSVIVVAVTNSIFNGTASSGYGIGTATGILTGPTALILTLTTHNNHKVKKWKYKIIINNTPIN